MAFHGIVLTSCNRPNWIQDAVRSLQGQDDPDFACVIADDSSIPEISAYLDGLARSDPRFSLIRIRDHQGHAQTNRFGFGINLALRSGQLSGSTVIHYLPDDDLFFDRSRLSRCRDYFTAHPEVVVAYGWQINFRTPELPRLEELAAMNEDDFIAEHNVRRYRRFHEIGIDPFCRLDHSQVVHRTECLAAWDGTDIWPSEASILDADAYFFRKLAAIWALHPMEFWVSAKRFHFKSILRVRRPFKEGEISEHA